MTVKGAVSSCQHVKPWSGGKGGGRAPGLIGGRGEMLNMCLIRNWFWG